MAMIYNIKDQPCIPNYPMFTTIAFLYILPSFITFFVAIFVGRFTPWEIPLISMIVSIICLYLVRPQKVKIEDKSNRCSECLMLGCNKDSINCPFYTREDK
eukprot:TRINITY_DN5543_c0_g1_i1.p1 TRINITY_DN5543_c0_g1~~TRINITY_DN5543_c0_g1_i1.p1  ORF type:complete len:101 (+),score=6.10 TRINITY_DN5543_c0_g1_i1:273-575(+)